MKKIIHLNLLLLFTLIASCMHAQNKDILIDALTDGRKITKYKGTDKDILASDFQNSDLNVYVKSEKPDFTLQVEDANGAFRQQDPLKNDDSPLQGFAHYLIPKRPGFTSDSLKLLFIVNSGSKKTEIKNSIGFKKGNAATAEKPGKKTEIPQCKLEAMKQLKYQFILLGNGDSGFCKKNDCGACYPVTERLEYDFKTNKTTYYDEKGNVVTPMPSVKVGSSVEFRIKNVNPLYYNVEISDSVVNLNKEISKLLGLLNAPPQVNGLTGTSDGAAVHATSDTCALTFSDSLGVALTEVAATLIRVQGQINDFSPYEDVLCIRKYFSGIKTSLDSGIRAYFSGKGIFSYEGFMQRVKSENIPYDDDLRKTVESVYNMLSVKQWSYVHKIPVVENVDALDIIFKIKPKDEQVALPVMNNSRVRLYTKGGFTWSVSSGIYFANGMANQQFSVRSDSDIVARANGIKDSVINRRGTLYAESDNKKSEFGFSSFFHFYPRISPGFNVSGLLGAGVTFEDKPQVRYFTGIGFLFGKETRIGLNFGGIFGRISQLSDQYTKDASGAYKPLSPAETTAGLQYKKRFIVKPFISLTYNLSFLKSSSSTVQKSDNTDASSGSKAAEKK